MNTKKEINSVDRLVEMIDRLNGLKESRRKKADALEAKAEEYFRVYDLTNLTDEHPRYAVSVRQLGRAYKWKDEAKKLRSFEPATDRRLRRFGQKLSELRTGILPGINTTQGVFL